MTTMNYLRVLILSIVLQFSLSMQAQKISNLILTADNITRVAEISNYTETTEYFTDISFHPAGKILATISTGNDYGIFHDGQIRFFDMDLREITLFEETLTGISIAYSPDGSLFAVGNGIGDDIGRLRVLDTITQEVVFDRQLDTAEIRDIAFSPNMEYIAVALGNAQVIEQLYGFVVISLKSNEVFFAGPLSQSFSIEFIDDEHLSVTNQTVQIWHIAVNTASLIYETNNANTIGSDIAVYRESQLFYKGEDGNQIERISFSQDIIKIGDSLPSIYSVGKFTIHPSEPLIAALYTRQYTKEIPFRRDGAIGIWDIETQTQLAFLEGHTDIIIDLAFSPDGTLLASGGADGTVRLWGIPSGE